MICCALDRCSGALRSTDFNRTIGQSSEENATRGQSGQIELRRRRKCLGRWVLGCCVGWAFPSAALAADAVESETRNKRPNILLMIADDMPWKAWGIRQHVCEDASHRQGGGRGPVDQRIQRLSGVPSLPVGSTDRSEHLAAARRSRVRWDLAQHLRHLSVDAEGSRLHGCAQRKGLGPSSTEPGAWTVPPTGNVARPQQILAKAGGGDRPFCFWWETILGHREFDYKPAGRGGASSSDRSSMARSSALIWPSICRTRALARLRSSGRRHWARRERKRPRHVRGAGLDE